MEYTYIITASSDNTLRVLPKMASLMSRNRLKMQQINVVEFGSEAQAHLSIALRTNDETIEKLVKQLRKITDLLDVKISHKTH